MKITSVEPASIAEELGIQEGDELLEINGRKALDHIDYRFSEGDAEVSIKVARGKEVVVYDIEKDEGEPIGLDFEEMKILSCGNDCIFCFVDQNPQGMRKQLYFRDGDYRLSFMYGNYTTMTNAGPAILQRIVDQRLSPQYISVHVTDYEVRKRLMGLKKDDRILEKIQFLHGNAVDMHTQIVLCPGLNDGKVLRRTIEDLYTFHRHIPSVAIVPVGLTDHRFNLPQLRRVDQSYARDLLDAVGEWSRTYRQDIGRNFVYPSDEFYLVAGRPIPPAESYDGFPQTENGVGMVRLFMDEFAIQAGSFPQELGARLTLATGELAADIIHAPVASRLREIRGLDVSVEVIPNVTFGRSVTVAGLLTGKCLLSSLKGKDLGDLLLLPPDILNADGLLLDDADPLTISSSLGVQVKVFDGSWFDVFHELSSLTENTVGSSKSGS